MRLAMAIAGSSATDDGDRRLFDDRQQKGPFFVKIGPFTGRLSRLLISSYTVHASVPFEVFRDCRRLAQDSKDDLCYERPFRFTVIACTGILPS